jgi:hypothetical protein
MVVGEKKFHGRKPRIPRSFKAVKKRIFLKHHGKIG